MCSPATCRQCGKTTWRGCGKHVDQVMSRVPEAQQCSCDRNAKVAPNRTGGFITGLFGRKGT